jgi:hypothetical protein
MILRISKVLDAPTLKTVEDVAAGSVFEPGCRTAGWSARTVKKSPNPVRPQTARSTNALFKVERANDQ